MSVILLTVFVGVVLVAFFVVMFLSETTGANAASERDALLPLTTETSRMTRRSTKSRTTQTQNEHE